MNRLGEEMKVIPRSAWALAVTICLALPVVVAVYAALAMNGVERGFFQPFQLFFGAVILVSFFFYILLIGYIAGDSRRRGMRTVLWVLLAVFIPNAIGIILYFILRDPLLRSCPKCGAASSSTYAFCSSCGTALSEACPSCRSAIGSGWSHCAKCGASLRTA